MFLIKACKKKKMKEAITEVTSKRIFTHQEDQLSGGDKQEG
jgi:hypothetical protein